MNICNCCMSLSIQSRTVSTDSTYLNIFKSLSPSAIQVIDRHFVSGMSAQSVGIEVLTLFLDFEEELLKKYLPMG